MLRDYIFYGGMFSSVENILMFNVCIELLMKCFLVWYAVGYVLGLYMVWYGRLLVHRPKWMILSVNAFINVYRCWYNGRIRLVAYGSIASIFKHEIYYDGSIDYLMDYLMVIENDIIFYFGIIEVLLTWIWRIISIMQADFYSNHFLLIHFILIYYLY